MAERGSRPKGLMPSFAQFVARARDVRFTPKSGHSARRLRCPLSAKSGHHWLAPVGPAVLAQLHVLAGAYLSCSRAARLTNAFDMMMIRAATATKHAYLWVPTEKIAILAAKFDGVASIEIRRIVKLLMATL